MTIGQWIAVIAAVLGGVGTIVLYRASYALQPYEGGIFGGPELDRWNAEVKRANARRLVHQKLGLGLLCASFLVQLVGALIGQVG